MNGDAFNYIHYIYERKMFITKTVSHINKYDDNVLLESDFPFKVKVVLILQEHTNLVFNHYMNSTSVRRQLSFCKTKFYFVN